MNHLDVDGSELHLVLFTKYFCETWSHTLKEETKSEVMREQGAKAEENIWT
jgi:hypothetical protein